MPDMQFKKNTLNLYGGLKRDKKFSIQSSENNTTVSTDMRNDLIINTNKLSLVTPEGTSINVVNSLNNIDMMAVSHELENFEISRLLTLFADEMSVNNIKVDKLVDNIDSLKTTLEMNQSDNNLKIAELDNKIRELQSIISRLTN